MKQSGIKGSYRFNYHGLILPFDSSDDENPQILVRIIPELNQAFNTKERAPFKIVCETIRYRELEEIEENGLSRAEQMFGDMGEHMPQITVVSEEDQAESQSENEGEPKAEEDPDGWERVSYGDLHIGGMVDPFANKFKNLIVDHKKISPYAMRYKSWTLKSMIVKANDDLRQEVLAMQLMRRLQ